MPFGGAQRHRNQVTVAVFGGAGQALQGLHVGGKQSKLGLAGPSCLATACA